MRKYYSAPVDAIHLQASFINAAFDGNSKEVLKIMSDPEFELSSETLEALENNLPQDTFELTIVTIATHASYKRALN